MNKILTILICVSLSACAQTEAVKFASKGADSKQQDMDEYLCERDARQTPGGTCVQVEMYEKCMAARGYTPIPGSGNKGMCAKIF